MNAMLILGMVRLMMMSPKMLIEVVTMYPKKPNVQTRLMVPISTPVFCAR